jgi:hypothetical protein
MNDTDRHSVTASHNAPEEDAHRIRVPRFGASCHLYISFSLHGALMQYPNKGCAPRLLPARSLRENGGTAAFQPNPKEFIWLHVYQILVGIMQN